MELELKESDLNIVVGLLNNQIWNLMEEIDNLKETTDFRFESNSTILKFEASVVELKELRNKFLEKLEMFEIVRQYN